MNYLLRLAEKRPLPDFLFCRLDCRWLCRARLWRQRRQVAARLEDKKNLLQQMRQAPIALAVDDANRQHDEVTPEFFRLVLSPRWKYSCCLWEPGTANLADAEEAMLALSCRRADIHDGQEVLDLGCGWGSFSLWLAEHYPQARIGRWLKPDGSLFLHISSHR